MTVPINDQPSAGKVYRQLSAFRYHRVRATRQTNINW